MDIFVYSDESGVFDRDHGRYFTYGGLVFLSIKERDDFARQYVAAEKYVRITEHTLEGQEIKGSKISPDSKRKLYKTIRRAERFGAVIDMSRLTRPYLFDNKKNKQRYLDWAFKMAVKMKFEGMIRRGLFGTAEVSHLHFFTDEHTTATAGIYELRESLETEFKNGVWNFDFMSYRKPLFTNLSGVEVKYCDSARTTIVRASDIIANRMLFHAYNNNGRYPFEESGLSVFYHP